MGRTVSGNIQPGRYSFPSFLNLLSLKLQNFVERAPDSKSDKGMNPYSVISELCYPRHVTYASWQLGTPSIKRE